MKAPERLETLLDYGILQAVVRPLMSGKEAQVYVVVAGGEECVAKVYKEASQRTFKHRSDYTEGRRTRNSRDQRAMSKRTRHGRRRDEDAWRSTEVDMIYRLRDAGVRVPEPLNFAEGVLVMELVTDAGGLPAPRLGDLSFSADEAEAIYQALLREVVRMLCAGVIHGDLSEFNVLMAADGPVLIDFPQAVDPARNPSAERLLLRDVENLHRFLARCAPARALRPYGQEMWSLFQANRLRPDTELTGGYRGPEGRADTREVMALIEEARREDRMRRGDEREGRDEAHYAEQDAEQHGEPRATAPARAPVPFRKVVDLGASAPQSRPGKPAGARRRRRRGGAGRPQADVPTQKAGEPGGKASAPKPQEGAAGDRPPRRRRRRRRSRRRPAPR